MVVTPYGIVATSYVQASQAGARILEQGGSAIDAGIAANAVLGVAEPMMNGIGGDLFAIYWEAKTGKRLGSSRADHRSSGSEGHSQHASKRHRFCNRAGCCRRLDQAA
jgi:gamma-glutamyltranspeptidase